MPVTLLTDATLTGATGIVVTSSSMRIERSGLVTVEAEFAFRTTISSAFRVAFEKGKTPPVALSKLDLASLQSGNVYLTDVDFKDEYGITRASARYAGARTLAPKEIELDISSTILNVTQSITTKAKPGFFTINPASSRPITFSESFVRGGSIGLSKGDVVIHTPARESRTFLILDSVWRVHNFTYRYALKTGEKPPAIQHTLEELVIPVSGKFKSITDRSEFLPVLSDQIDAVNSEIAVYSRTFTAERVQGLVR
jgi:hypothetical protein